MIPAATIHAALEGTLRASGLLDRVERCAQDDLSAALADIRDSSETIAILIPMGEEITHQTLPDDNTPLRAEIRSKLALLVTGGNLSRTSQGGEDLPVKDALLALLMWEDLGIPSLITFPTATEPLRVEFDGGSSRDAFRIDLEFRRIIIP